MFPFNVIQNLIRLSSTFSVSLWPKVRTVLNRHLGRFFFQFYSDILYPTEDLEISP